MNRFTLFALRLIACVLVLLASIVLAIVRVWGGAPSGDVWRGMVLGLILAWAVSPPSEDLHAFIGLMTTDKD